LLLSGCATPSARRGADRPETAPKVDYSKSAVEARTESQARYAAAILHELNDEAEAAAEDYYQAAVADPANESLAVEASSRLLRQKMTDRAIEILKRCADRPGASGNVHARLGLAYSVAGKKDLALAANQMAIRKDPDLFQGYQYLAQLHLQNGQAAEGLKVLDDAAKRTGANAEFLVDLGEAYISFGRGGSAEIKPRALEAFRRAAALKPPTPALLQRLADGFHQLGDSDRAIEFYLLLLE
jgi:tetratricopeptide (TPR) repeat protein